jgi:predicted alpha/beta-fold hydrolase
MEERLLDARQTRELGTTTFVPPAPFVPRAPWWGGDLQTLRNYLRKRRRPDLSPWPGLRLELPVLDGSGDRLSVCLHQPAIESGRPIAVLIHGLTGSENSVYLRASARHLLSQGYPVVRLNQRGAGPSRPLCQSRYHAGLSGDLGDALKALADLDSRLISRGVVLVGYSLGGNILLKFLAETGRDYPIGAAATVSTPIDLAASVARIMSRRNRPYHNYLLSRMKAEEAARPEPLTTAERSNLERVARIYDFDETVVAPRAGFSGADEYYRRCSALGFLDRITVPTLLIHATDDPWVPAAPYGAFSWQRTPNLQPLISERGGHVGFHGRGSPVAWQDQAIAGFFATHLGF